MASRRSLSWLVAIAGLAALAPPAARAAGPFEGDFVGAEGEQLSLRQ
jgi:hypothetical protein